MTLKIKYGLKNFWANLQNCHFAKLHSGGIAAIWKKKETPSYLGTAYFQCLKNMENLDVNFLSLRYHPVFVKFGPQKIICPPIFFPQLQV